MSLSLAGLARAFQRLTSIFCLIIHLSTLPTHSIAGLFKFFIFLHIKGHDYLLCEAFVRYKTLLNLQNLYMAKLF